MALLKLTIEVYAANSDEVTEAKLELATLAVEAIQKVRVKRAEIEVVGA